MPDRDRDRSRSPRRQDEGTSSRPKKSSSGFRWKEKKSSSRNDDRHDDDTHSGRIGGYRDREYDRDGGSSSKSRRPRDEDEEQRDSDSRARKEERRRQRRQRAEEQETRRRDGLDGDDAAAGKDAARSATSHTTAPQNPPSAALDNDLVSKFGASAAAKFQKSAGSNKSKQKSDPDASSATVDAAKSTRDRPVATGPRPGEPMILVKVNDRLGTAAQIPCFASDNVGLFKAQVAAKIGRRPHEILLKRQGERPFKDVLTLEDYGVSNGVQIDLELAT